VLVACIVLRGDICIAKFHQPNLTMTVIMLLLPSRHRVSIVAIIAARLSPSPAETRFAVTAFTPHISHTHCSRSRSHITGSMSQLSSSATAASPALTTSTRYILSYNYIPDVLEKRGPFREGHLGLAKSMVADGTCISGGPTLPPGQSVPNGGECPHPS
jgi:hypothetical protein